jgi:LuxR family maltose regulon positive regulatory protein
MIRVYQALAAETQAEALTLLSEALMIGEPESYIRTFVDEGKLLVPLLRKAISQGITPEYAARLLNIYETEERQRRERQGTAAARPTFGILSERETEVLRLLAAGLSNIQIAEKLVISLGTVKAHVHSICEKLNAKTRTQAIARARELKLT